MTNSVNNILITGGEGQLASAIYHQREASPFRLIAYSKQSLDITETASITAALEQHTPHFVINTAAFTAVDLAESEEQTAMKINHDGARNLAIACHSRGIPLLHISTDYVFDGSKQTPYFENDTASPINIYGKSKWLGEQAIREHCDKHIILRVSGVFSQYGKNFYKTILKLAQEKPELTIVADQFTCPTFADDIANAIFTIIRKSSAWGTYHYCGAPSASWHMFASKIIEHGRKKNLNIASKIKPIPTSDYKTPAARPLNSVLDCSKIKSTFGISQPSWKDALTQLDTL